MCWPHPNSERCPAIGKNCDRCWKRNHLASVCRSVVNKIQLGDSENPTYSQSNIKSFNKLYSVKSDSESEASESYVYAVKG